VCRRLREHRRAYDRHEHDEEERNAQAQAL
jgi:hypothetical protein